ncbi:MAG: ATP-grasp domain-containing protein [Alphaproteobacteria bacterium]|nr:ATP-grasp domain-containing protein [Alphaproteobacteria bacterium]
MTQKILLATTVKWPSAAYLAGAFAAFGCFVEAVFPRGHVLGVSRHLGRAHIYHPLRPHSSFVAAITASSPDLVIPCDDRAVLRLLSIQAAAPELSALLAESLGKIESYPLMMARGRASAIAQAEGISTPLTATAADESELARALEFVGLPAVLKADGSWGGDGVAVARTQEEAGRIFHRLAGPPSRPRSLARAVLRQDLHFLHEALAPKAAAVEVQQFIAGGPATSAFVCRDGKVLASIHMDVVESRGPTGPASLIRQTDCSRMDEAVRRIARRFALNGLHGLDFVRDQRGVPHLIEINPRATQICHLALGAGHDLPSALLGLPPRPITVDKPLIALFPQAWLQGRLAPDARAAYLDVPWNDPAVLAALAAATPDEPARALQFLTGGLAPNRTRPSGLRL